MRLLGCVLITLMLSSEKSYSSDADQLFESDMTLPIILTGPFKVINKERDKTKQYTGSLKIANNVVDVQFRPRGNNRLKKKVCSSAPLKILFDKQSSPATVFDNQSELKLVVLCRQTSRYQDYIRIEYLIYKLLNKITEKSYRARWVDIVYQDTDQNVTPRREKGFFIEQKKRMAKRLDLNTVDVKKIKLKQIDPEQAALLALFQFVISNADYSLLTSIAGKNCCHNAKLLLDKNDDHIPFIYDFDSSGLVNPSYAIPSASLPITRVTHRLYRGYCRHNESLKAAREQLIASSDELIVLFESDPILSSRAKPKAVKFLRKSFKLLENDKQYSKNITGACRD